jgi:hypothetical protein
VSAEFNKVLVLSTGHMPADTMRMLGGLEPWWTDPDMPMHANYVWGTFVWCDSDNGNGWRDKYPELARVLDFALARGCQWVRFDSDGPLIEELPQWEW